MIQQKYACATQASNTNLIRLPHILKKINISRSTLYTWIDKNSRYFIPSFPKPVRLGTGRSIFWVEADVETWLSNQLPIASDTLPDHASKRKPAASSVKVNATEGVQK